jgi:hypothetical protein
MQALFYFVDDVLGKYGTDPFATWLLDHRVLYIVPLVNPDGYAVNEAYYNSMHSFHFWRKNTRDNNLNSVFDEASDGVDINRNFAVHWGADDVGSSPDSSQDNYRGPSAFSEIETRVQRDKFATLKPVTALSFHTFSDLFVHSWGTTGLPLADSAAFDEWSDAFTRDNGYLSGPAPDILYSVNGDFNDWAYGDTLLKPKAFTWTPELGSDIDGFYPPPSRMVPLSLEALRPSYLAAAIAGPYVASSGLSPTSR